ncbi:MAG: helix-turn-helix transcriptional regulator [Acidobacteriota bacterium]
MLEPEVLGAALRLLRTQRKMQQKEVARRAGITSSMLSGYEQGRRAPTLASVEKILQALGCGLGELVAAIELLRQAASPSLPRWGSLGAVGGERPTKEGPGDGSLDLDSFLGESAKELPDEARKAFAEMLNGYRRWLRFLCETTVAQVGGDGRRETPS